jgi:hypothetical protein
MHQGRQATRRRSFVASNEPIEPLDPHDPTVSQTPHESVKADHVVVGVHADDPDEVERAAAVLAKQDPVRVERFDAEGRLLRG